MRNFICAFTSFCRSECESQTFGSEWKGFLCSNQSFSELSLARLRVMLRFDRMCGIMLLQAKQQKEKLLEAMELFFERLAIPWPTFGWLTVLSDGNRHLCELQSTKLNHFQRNFTTVKKELRTWTLLSEQGRRRSIIPLLREILGPLIVFILGLSAYCFVDWSSSLSPRFVPCLLFALLVEWERLVLTYSYSYLHSATLLLWIVLLATFMPTRTQGGRTQGGDAGAEMVRLCPTCQEGRMMLKKRLVGAKRWFVCLSDEQSLLRKI